MAERRTLNPRARRRRSTRSPSAAWPSVAGPGCPCCPAFRAMAECACVNGIAKLTHFRHGTGSVFTCRRQPEQRAGRHRHSFTPRAPARMACWLVGGRADPRRGRVTGTVQVTLIFDLTRTPGPAGRVTPGPLQVSLRAVRGQRGPRPGRGDAMTPGRRLARLRRELMPMPGQQDRAAPAGRSWRLSAGSRARRSRLPARHGNPSSGPDDHRGRGSERFGEPLLQPRFRSLYVRNHRGAAASPDRR